MLEERPIKEPAKGSKLKPYRGRYTLHKINMLGYATKEDWTIGRQNEIEEDLVIIEEQYSRM